MDKTIRTIGIRLSVLLFFIMALAGWMYGQEPVVCAWRAMIGATALYLVVRIAGNLVVRMLVEAMAQDQVRRREQKH